MGRWSDALTQVSPQAAEQPIESTGRWSNALNQGQAANQAEDLPPEAPEFDITQTRQAENQPELEDLPELGFGGLLSGESVADTAKIAAALAVTTDSREMGNILNSVFPHIKITENSPGVFVANNTRNGAKSVINKPGLSPLDVAQGGAAIAAFTPAGQAAQIPIRGAAKVGAAALAAGATETAIQSGQEALGGDFDKTDVALSAGLGAAGEKIGQVVESVQRSRIAKKLRTEESSIAEVSKDISKAERTTAKTGVKLFPAQKTLDPFAIEEQAFIASLPAAARKARRALLKQNKQIGTAVDQFLGKISSAKSVETGSQRARDAAKSRIDSLEKARKTRSGPLFRKAFLQAKAKNLNVDVSSIIDLVNKAQKDAPDGGALQKSLSKVSRLISDEAETVIKGAPLKKLQNVKFELDNMIEGPAGKVLDSTVKRQLTIIQKKLVAEMTGASPLYKKANAVFESISKPIDEIKKTLVGKIAGVKDVNLKSIAGLVFDQAETNPTIIQQTKKIINAQDPTAWRSIVRVEAQKRLKNIDLDIDKLTPDNAPAKIHRALFGSGQKRDIFLGALNKEQQANALFLEDALIRAAKGRPGGSQTGVRNVITEKIKGIGISIRRFLTNPIQRAVATGEESAFNRSVVKMGDMLFDTEWAPRLSKIRKIRNVPESVKAMTQLLNDIEGSSDDR